MAQPSILRHMAAVADVTRCRLLRLLERQELTVGELCTVAQLPQSTVSRHLKALAEDGWLASRRDGTSRFYGLATTDLEPDARSLWQLVAEQLNQTPAAAQDDLRLAGVLENRRSRAREFFSSAAGEWDRLREELFGSTIHLRALLALLDERWVVADLGCGTGQVAEAVAPFVLRVIGVDGAPEMLAAARERLQGIENAELRQGELEELPLPDQALDAALLVLVLHYVPDPARALAEIARVLRPGGRVLVVDMLPHEREEFQRRMGHVWLGFSQAQLERSLEHAGFAGGGFHPLPSEPAAAGPALFAATARRAETALPPPRPMPRAMSRDHRSPVKEPR